MTRKTTYLLAWKSAETDDNQDHLLYEQSTVQLFREQHVTTAGIVRGDHTVIAFSDYIHGDDYLTKDELRVVAKSWLDGDYKTINIDFTQ